MEFSDSRIDAQTGSIGLRAELPNAGRSLVPGQFVRVRLLGIERPNAIVLPQRAVLQGQQGKFVLVVGAGDVVEMRPVEVGRWVGQDWLIESGLAAGDRVIVDGTVKAQPGRAGADRARRPQTRRPRRQLRSDGRRVMFSHFFIRRPIFASVLSIVIVLAGRGGDRNLPIAQYPEISPPQVTVTAFFPGATGEALQRTVAAPIEEQINGVEGMLYLNSIATGGLVTTTVTFEVGTDVDLAANNVANRVRLAEPSAARGGAPQRRHRPEAEPQLHPDRHPDLARRHPGRRRRSRTTRRSTWSSRSSGSRASATCMIFGARDYSMRIWLDPEKLARLGLTVERRRRARCASRTRSSRSARSAPSRRRPTSSSPTRSTPRTG